MRTYQGIQCLVITNWSVMVNVHHRQLTPVFLFFCFLNKTLFTCRTSGPSVAGLETTYSGGNGFSTSYNSQRWLNLYLSACKLLDLALALPPESLPQFQMSVQTLACMSSSGTQ